MNPQAAVCWGGIPRVGRRLSGKLEGREQGGAEGCSEIGRDSDFAGLRLQMCTSLGFWDASFGSFYFLCWLVCQWVKKVEWAED